MARVALEGVTKVFPSGVMAVNGLDLEVQDGELLVLLGPSGCGKTTTLRLIAGLEAVSSGEIRIGDRTVTHAAPRDRNIAMVFQSSVLYPHLSVYRNMAFSLEMRYGGGWLSRIWRRLTDPPKAEALAAKRRGIRGEVEETCRALGIERLLDRMPRQLSGGECQRVALGKALVRRPAVFLLDEPMSNLDGPLRSEMRHELHDVHRRIGATIVHVTHDQTEAMTLGERIAVMEWGRIRQVGSPLEVYDRPAHRFVAEFLGSPGMNFVRGRLEEEGGRKKFRGEGVEWEWGQGREGGPRDWATAPRELDLGVRPEDVRVVAGSISCGETEGITIARGAVSHIESLGDGALTHIRFDGAAEGGNAGGLRRTWVSKTSRRVDVRRGDVVGVAVDVERVHWFDARSGDRWAT